MHYKTRYEERHQPIDTTGEAEMINYFQPKRCPFCESEDFIKYGHDNNGIDRYKCSCGKFFKPTTGTIFDSRKIGVCEWIEDCLNIFRYVSLNADSWNNRNAISTSKYWLEKLFLTLENTQNDIILSGTVWLDETYYALMMRDRKKDLQNYLNLYSFVINSPSDHLEKVEKIINLVFENPKSLKYRDQFR